MEGCRADTAIPAPWSVSLFNPAYKTVVSTTGISRTSPETVASGYIEGAAPALYRQSRVHARRFRRCMLPLCTACRLLPAHWSCSSGLVTYVIISWKQ